MYVCTYIYVERESLKSKGVLFPGDLDYKFVIVYGFTLIFAEYEQLKVFHHQLQQSHQLLFLPAKSPKECRQCRGGY